MLQARTPSRICRTATALSASLVLLTACGGGGGGGAPTPTGPVTSTLSFPLQTGYRTLTANGAANNFTIIGTCSGSGSHTVAGAKTATTFEGAAALSGASTWTLSFTNCTPSSTAATSTTYYDSNYIPRGFSSVGINYGVYLTAPTIPSSIMVGNTGTIGTQTLYTNSTKTVGNGTSVVSYVVEPDTATTAIINLIDRSYNSSGTLTATEQDRYRIDSAGNWTPLSADIQYAYTSTTHLVFTF